jgi:peptidoglycan/LPS O-acetylase OafA/YrhL
MRQQEIRGLTSLRGIAAFYVVLLHFSATAQTVSVGIIPSLAPEGVLAVDLFFVLSGFIMAYTYLDDFQTRGLRAFPDFIGKRIARIEPLNIVLLLILVACAATATFLFGGGPFPRFQWAVLYTDLPANLLLLQGLGIGHNLNGPSWSISDEFAAYLIFPLLLKMAFHPLRIVCMAVVLAAVALLSVMASKQPHLGMDPTGYGIYWDVVRCFSEFVLGLVSYRFFKNERYQKALSSDTSLAIVAIAIAIFVVARLGDLFAVLLFPALIIAIARNQTRGKQIFELRILYFTGLISYSLYLVHGPIRPIERALVQALHPAPLSIVSAMTFAALGALSVIPIAALSYHLIEKPGRAIFRRLLPATRRLEAGASATQPPTLAAI